MMPLRPGGEPILEPAAGLLGELLLRPTPSGRHFLREEYVSGERANLVDRIRGQINDKRSYATLRLGQLMCGEEAFGVDKLGDVEHAAAVTPGLSVGAVSAAAAPPPRSSCTTAVPRRRSGWPAP